MSENPLRVGVLGCGKITQTRHAPEYAANEKVRIVGFFDFIQERAEALAKQYGGRTFSSAEELIACDEIDAVSICTSNNTHAELAVAALRAGKHVLCEKPMATTAEECEAMLKEAHSAHKKLAIAQNQRLYGIHQKAKELVDRGTIGKPLSFKTCFGHKGPDYWSVDTGTGNWFFDKSRSAFGAIADLGIHKIDVMRYLLGCEIKQVQAMCGTLDKRDKNGNPVSVDDNAIVLCRMENGAMGTVFASWTYYGEEDNNTILYGSEGIMKLSVEEGRIDVLPKDGERVTYRVPPMEASGVIDAFVRSVLRDEDSVISADAVYPSMKVLFAAVESCRTGNSVCL